MSISPHPIECRGEFESLLRNKRSSQAARGDPQAGIDSFNSVESVSFFYDVINGNVDDDDRSITMRKKNLSIDLDGSISKLRKKN